MVSRVLWVNNHWAIVSVALRLWNQCKITMSHFVSNINEICRSYIGQWKKIDSRKKTKAPPKGTKLSLTEALWSYLEKLNRSKQFRCKDEKCFEQECFFFFVFMKRLKIYTILGSEKKKLIFSSKITKDLWKNKLETNHE